MEEIKAKTGITQEQISSARQEREDNIKETTRKLRIKGYSCREIANKIPYCKEKTIKETSARLRKRNILTEEDMKIGNIEKKVREIVLKGLREGLTEQEIIDSCKVKLLDEETLQGYINDFIEDGYIAKEQIIEAREAKGKREEEHSKKDTKTPERYEREIETLYRLGFSGRQIMKVTQLSSGYVRKIRDKCGISAKQSEEWQKAREEMANNRKIGILKMLDTTAEIDSDLIRKHIEYMKAKLQLGDIEAEDVKAIGLVIPMSAQFITNTNVNLILTYYTRNEDKASAIDFMNACIGNPEINTNIKQRIEQAKQDMIEQDPRYAIVIKTDPVESEQGEDKLGDSKEDEEKAENEKIKAKETIEKYKSTTKTSGKPIIRIEFIRDQIKAAITLERKLNIKNVQGLVEYIKANMILGEEVRSDIELLRQITQTSPELMNMENIDIVVNESLKAGNARAAILFVNECITTCQEVGGRFYEAVGNRLEDYRAEIEKRNEAIKHKREEARRNSLGLQIPEEQERVRTVSVPDTRILGPNKLQDGPEL